MLQLLPDGQRFMQAVPQRILMFGLGGGRAKGAVMERPDRPLNGLRILVVEDNFLAAEACKQLLEMNGCDVVGPTGRVEAALALVGGEGLDGALLDINLAGESSFPIARALRERGVPFMFLTGYDDSALIPSDLRSARRLGKPIANQLLIDAMEDAFTSLP